MFINSIDRVFKYIARWRQRHIMDIWLCWSRQITLSFQFYLTFTNKIDNFAHEPKPNQNNVSNRDADIYSWRSHVYDSFGEIGQRERQAIRRIFAKWCLVSCSRRTIRAYYFEQPNRSNHKQDSETSNKKMRMYLQGKRKTIYKMRDYLYGTSEHRKDRDTWSRNNNKCANYSNLELRLRNNVIIFNPNFIGRRIT